MQARWEITDELSRPDKEAGIRMKYVLQLNKADSITRCRGNIAVGKRAIAVDALLYLHEEI